MNALGIGIASLVISTTTGCASTAQKTGSSEGTGNGTAGGSSGVQSPGASDAGTTTSGGGASSSTSGTSSGASSDGGTTAPDSGFGGISASTGSGSTSSASASEGGATSCTPAFSDGFEGDTAGNPPNQTVWHSYMGCDATTTPPDAGAPGGGLIIGIDGSQHRSGNNSLKIIGTAGEGRAFYAINTTAFASLGPQVYVRFCARFSGLASNADGGMATPNHCGFLSMYSGSPPSTDPNFWQDYNHGTPTGGQIRLGSQNNVIDWNNTVNGADATLPDLGPMGIAESIDPPACVRFESERLLPGLPGGAEENLVDGHTAVPRDDVRDRFGDVGRGRSFSMPCRHGQVHKACCCPGIGETFLSSGHDACSTESRKERTMNFDKVLYTAKAHTTGGREGASRTDDGRLDIKLTPPGSPGGGTNPEQLFAVGWSACFLSAIKIVASKTRVTLPSEPSVDAEVDLGLAGGGHVIRARLNVNLPGLERNVAQAVVDGAHLTCPYSKATHGNIDVTTNVIV